LGPATTWAISGERKGPYLEHRADSSGQIPDNRPDASELKVEKSEATTLDEHIVRLEISMYQGFGPSKINSRSEGELPQCGRLL
jgi:hypothetical protein